MKTIGFWNRYPQLSTNNHLFMTPNAPIGDDLLLPFNELYLEARARDIRLVTLDLVNDIDALDGIVFVDYPSDPFGLAALRATDPKVPRYLITFEPPVVCDENWRTGIHEKFTKVFTWDDHALASRYVKINYAQRFPRIMPRNPRDHLAVMIASNKSSDYPLELYSERLKTIEWFEWNRPNDFHLFGPGWDGTKHRCYRGFVQSKREELQRHTFAICYENARSLPGYITEKLFDCFIAGCIPVYWGAPNIADHVPCNCYIDRRAFHDDADLYGFLTRMPDAVRSHMLDSIEAFTKSESARPFTIERFVETILAEIG